MAHNCTMSSKCKVYKIVILGDGAVGKTTTINALNTYITTQGKTLLSNKPTQRTKFIDFQAIYKNHGSKAILQIWDCQGQRLDYNHPLDLIKPTILQSSSIIILMFAVNDSTTLENILFREGWLDMIEPLVLKNHIPVVLLGNKVDRPADVYEEYVKKKIQTIPYISDYLAISSLTGTGIPELAGIIQKHLDKQLQNTVSAHTQLSSPPITPMHFPGSNTT